MARTKNINVNNNIDYYQQGDVLICPCQIPNDAKKIKGGILQEGEHTGHAHRLTDGDYAIFETPKKERFLRIVKPTTITHEEHQAFQIDPGEYKIGIVEEFDPFAQMIRTVLD